MNTDNKTNHLIGHINQRQALSSLVTEERLPASLIFSGAPGIGKRLVALELATKLLCEKSGNNELGGCQTCQACRLVSSGNHPDLRLLDWEGDEMSVDDLRGTLEKLSLRPFLGARKVTIFNDADNISVVGANILLKTLEEPRPENFFILTVTTPSRLPQTVLSRCQRWFFDRLSNAELEEILKQRWSSDDELKLIPLADGSVAALDKIKANASIREDALSALDASWRGDIALMTKFAQDWAAEKNSIAERLVSLRVAIRERLLAGAGDRHAAAVWANGLQNAIDAEYLINDRHVNATLMILAVLKSCDAKLALGYQITPNSLAPVWERILG